jgi:hypothetical protein
MRKFTIPHSIIIISLTILICLCVFSSFNIWDCRRRNITVPESLIYPDSTLIDYIDGGTSVYRQVTKRFVTTASPEAILEFYESNGANCSETHCSGYADPNYAEYTILINELYADQGQTTYVIEIRWRGCTNKLT